MSFLLVTDLDNTLIGDHAATLTLNRQLQQQRDQAAPFYLVYATGRSLSSFRQLCQDFQESTGEPLLTPDFLIAGVGSEIYGAEQQLDRDWAAHLSENWHRQAIVEIAQTFAELQPQEDSAQNPWKISYCLDDVEPNGKVAVKTMDQTDKTVIDKTAIIEQLQLQLATHQLAATVIFSSNRDLDILPHKGDKGKAVNYLRKKLNVSTTATLVCGDSGNDIALFEQQTLGVVMANALPELRDWHTQYGQPHHYLATTPFAGGILEALHYFKLI
jgi:sucrose-6-phosphatase